MLFLFVSSFMSCSLQTVLFQHIEDWGGKVIIDTTTVQDTAFSGNLWSITVNVIQSTRQEIFQPAFAYRGENCCKK